MSSRAGMLLACLALAACGKAATESSTAPTTPATPTAPSANSPTPPASGTITVPSQPVSPAEQAAKELMDRAMASRKCSLAYFTSTNFNPSVKQVLVDAGLIGQLATDAKAVAGPDVQWWFSRFPPNGDVAQAELYLHALDDTSVVLVHPLEVRVRATAYLAYYEGIASRPRCPLDPELLQLINKPSP